MSDPGEPIAGLAREIRRHAEQFLEDDAADPEEFARAIGALPERERERIVLDTFGRLPAEEQWAILERLFGDQVIAAHLTAEREARVAELTLTTALRTIVDAARAADRLDVTVVPIGEQLTVGLFREPQVRSAIAAGHRATTCARQVVLRHHDAGLYRVVEDVFNPRGGLYVTAEYDHRTWEAERLEPHAVVQPGSALDGASQPAEFEPSIYPGGRFDVLVGEQIRRSALHVGFIELGAIDVFAG